MSSPTRQRSKYAERREQKLCTGCSTYSPVYSRCDSCRARKREQSRVNRQSTIEEVFILEPPTKRDPSFWHCDCPFLYNCIKCGTTYGENQIKDIGGYYLSCPKGHVAEVADESLLFPILCPHDEKIIA